MSAIQLTSYSIRITDRNEHISLPLGDFFEGEDLFSIMTQSFSSLRQGLSNDSEYLTSFGITRFKATAQRHISGIIRSGDYGYETDLVNVNSNEVMHHRKTDETDLKPFYFLVHLPQGATRGTLLIERKGMYGVKTVFSDYFISNFIEHFPEVMLSIDLLTPDYLIEKVLNEGRFTEIDFIKVGVPNNFEDVIANSGGNFLTHGQIKRTISAPKGGFLGNVADRIRDFRKDQRTIHNMYEIPDEYDNIKVKVEINGQYRTMDISRLESFRPNHNITKEVEIGDDGNPTYESINRAAFRLLNVIISSLGEDYAR